MTAVTPDDPRFERLRALTEVSRALTYTTSTEEVLRLTVERAADLMGAEKALLMLTDADGLLEVRASHGIDDERVNALREPLQETLIRRLQDLLDNPGEECFLSVPLVVQGQVTGLLAAVRSSGEPVTHHDEWLLSALADQAAVAIENARLTDTVRRERDESNRIVEAHGRAHATLGHELRSPLTAIQSYSALLLEDLMGPLNDRQRESISRIQLSGRHLLSIIENVLDMARLDSGVLSVASSDIPVAGILEEAVQMVQPSAAEKQQELRYRSPKGLVVRADPNRLRQALLNLIGNAIKYTPDRGVIQVHASTTQRDDRPFAAIAIQDDGPGMSDEVLSTIFEPYNRGGEPERNTGLGLGLFISREIVRQMGGDIEVESQLGAGSTFTAFFPVATSDP